MKWIIRLTLTLVLAYIIYIAYIYHKKGYFSLPPLANNEYPISFKSGFRAIVAVRKDLEEEFPPPRILRRLTILIRDRGFIGVPMEVPAWVENKWSRCSMLLQTEQADAKAEIEIEMPAELRNDLVGARVEAVCYFVADDQKIPRGVIYSVPRH